MTDGWLLGWELGELLGCVLGMAEGCQLGSALGELLGCVLGMAEGCQLGSALGVLLGWVLGIADGCIEVEAKAMRDVKNFQMNSKVCLYLRSWPNRYAGVHRRLKLGQRIHQKRSTAAQGV